MTNIIFYMLLLFVSYIGGKIFGKLCSNLVIGGSAASYSLYFIFNGIVACIFFFISGGFKLSINTPTAIYSIAYALLAALSVVGLAAYKLTNITTITIITTTGSLLTTSTLGAILFKETVDIITIIRILIMLVAVTFTFLDKKGSDTTNTNKEKSTRRTYVLLFIVIVFSLLNNCVATIVTKYYALDPNVVDENSFFFFTNVFLIAFSAIAFFTDSIISREHFKAAVKMLNPKKSLALVGNTVCSNISSLVGILLIALINVSVYSPITSALGIISGVVASIFLREKIGVFSYLAASIACIAVII